MSKPDIQYFAEDGTWVKPPGAVRVEVTLKGGDGSAPAVRSFTADDLPDAMAIMIGQPGESATVITHLRTGEKQ